MHTDNGNIITLRAYKGQLIERTVVSETSTHVIVCLSEEWKTAGREHRPPACVGFHKSDIVQIKETENT
jgi:hypothetical protein